MRLELEANSKTELMDILKSLDGCKLDVTIKCQSTEYFIAGEDWDNITDRNHMLRAARGRLRRTSADAFKGGN